MKPRPEWWLAALGLAALVVLPFFVEGTYYRFLGKQGRPEIVAHDPNQLVDRISTGYKRSKHLEIGTVSGDASVRAAGPGEVAVKAVSGDVDVAVRRGLRVRLDVNSVSGTIGSELDVSDTPPQSGGPEASLRVRTTCASPARWKRSSSRR